MNIKRFVAPDMRQAIRMVRKTFGEDAVILSNKKVPEGVELMAALDFDEQELRDQSDQQGQDVPTFAQKETSVSESIQPEQDSGKVKEMMQTMQQEMHAMRQLMLNEFGQLNWHEMGQHQPYNKELFSRLMNLGLASDLSRHLVEQVGSLEDVELGWSQALDNLSGQLMVTGDDFVAQAGVIALIGPTGVGKTTSIAKLAAAYAMRFGHRHVALVTIDNFRIGAKEQLHTYGRILNVPVKTASSAAELDSVLDSLSDRRLILIDTAGVSRQHPNFEDQKTMLQDCTHRIRKLLTLSAATDPVTLGRVISSFSDFGPDACILTKIDEVFALGGAISSLINAQLPLAYTTDGQRVPEDIQVARALQLIKKAEEVMKTTDSQYDSTHLAHAYGDAYSYAHA